MKKGVFWSVIFMSLFFIQIAVYADFIIEAENYDSGGMGNGYYDYNGTPDRYPIAGFDAVTMLPEGGSYRISYIQNGEWIKYTKEISVEESGVYEIYLRGASNVDGIKVRMLNSLNGATAQEVPGSDVTFNRTGNFAGAAGAKWKDIYMGTTAIKQGTNKFTLEFVTGVADDWQYSVNYLKFVKLPIAELRYYNTYAQTTPSSFLISHSDYLLMNKWGEGNYNIPPNEAYKVQVLGDIEEALVNDIQEVRGYVWNLRDSSYKYLLDVEIYNSAGTTLLGKMENFARATEENPDILYATSGFRNMINTGQIPIVADYHGFTLGKAAILEHAKYRFGIAQGTAVKIKIVPRNDAGSLFDTRNLFSGNMISGVIPTIPIYDTSVTIDHTDMSKFPLITVDFTTTGIDDIAKLGGSSSNGTVNELSDIRSGEGEVDVINTRPSTGGGPIDVIVVYEDTNSMNNAALTKIQNTLNTLQSQGFDVKVKYITFAIGPAQTGIWANAKNAMESAINSFYLPRNPTPDVLPYKWIVLAAAANNYSPVASEMSALANKMVRNNIIFTVVDQDTGNNASNDIASTFIAYSEGIRYYAGHLGIGKTGDYMLDTANLFLLPSAKVKKWRMTYNSPIPDRDGTERKERFTIVDRNNVNHGPAIAYYRAPRYGVKNQTIVMYTSSSAFDWRVKPFTFTDNLAGTDYEAVKYVNTSGLDAVSVFGYNNDRHFQPLVTSTGAFNNSFSYTGEEIKNYTMINKSVLTDTYGTQRVQWKNTSEQAMNLYYPTKYFDYTNSVNGDTFKWTWSRYVEGIDGKFFVNEKVMIRLVKGASTTAVNERYNVFVPENQKLPYVANDMATPDNAKIIEFLSNPDRRYIDFVFNESDSISLLMDNGVLVVYTPQSFIVTGLPMLERYTAQLYTMKDSIDGTTRIITYENGQEFLVEKPAIDRGPNSTDNDIFSIDFIKSEGFPNIEAYFTTKTRFEPAITYSSIYLKDPTSMSGVTVKPGYERPTTGGNMEEIQRSTSGAVVLGKYLENIDLGADDVMPSGLAGFQYPLDIVFALDNTGSMQNEIENTANALGAFSQSLADMGFNVKFRLIIFGKGGMSGTAGIGDSGESVTYYDRDYLALFNRAWYSTNASDILDLKTRMNAVANSASGGYRDITGEQGQENGQMAIYYAIQELKNGGRSVDRNRNILNDDSGVLPSKKLIIFLTDELMDDGTIPPGCSRATLMTDLRNMMDISEEDKINLTGIFHIQNFGTNADAIMRDPLYAANYGDVTVDCAGYPAEAFYDDTSGTSKRYYTDFALAFGEYVRPVSQAKRFRYYEMGTNGTNVGNSLLAAASDMGMIKRWKVVFPTPHTNTDGTYRDVFFDLKNIAGYGTASIIPALKDVTESPARRYKAPVHNLELTVTEPVSGGAFRVTGAGNLAVEGTVGARVVPPSYVRAWITTRGGVGMIPNAVAQTSLAAIYYPNENEFRYQDFRIESIPVGVINRYGTEFDVYVEAYNVRGEKVSKTVFDVNLETEVDIEMTNPTEVTTGNVFKVVNNKVILEGRAGGRNIGPSEITAIIRVAGDTTVDVATDNIDLDEDVFRAGEVGFDYQDFVMGNINRSDLARTGKKFFDVYVTVKNRYDVTYTEILRNVRLDGYSPKITALNVTNTTNKTMWENAKLRGGARMFDDDKVKELTRLEYYETNIEAWFGTAFAENDDDIEPELTFGEFKDIDYNGERSKPGDVLELRIRFVALGVDTLTTTNINSAVENVVAINARDITNSNEWKSADTITVVGTRQIPKKPDEPTNMVTFTEYEAIWRITVAEVLTEAPRGVDIRLIDSGGYSLSEATVGNDDAYAQITRILVGGHTEKYEMEVQTVKSTVEGNNIFTSDTTETSLVFTEASDLTWLNLGDRFPGAGDSIVAARIYYKRIWNESDLGAITISALGMADDVNLTDPDYTKYFYAPANNQGKAIAQFLTDLGGADDGSYRFAVQLIELAGAGTDLPLNQLVMPQKLYVDHIAPRISDAILTKASSGSGAPILDSSKYRTNDTIYVTYKVNEYNISSGDMPHFRNHVTNSAVKYADYSTLIAFPATHDPWVEQTGYTTTVNGIGVFTLKGGDKQTADTVIPVVITGPQANPKFIVGAYDRAKNQAELEVPVTIDNSPPPTTSPTLAGGMYISPVEIIGRKAGVGVNSVVTYTDGNGNSQSVITMGIKNINTSVTIATTEGALYHQSTSMTALNTVANHKSGTTAYTRIKDGFLGVNATSGDLTEIDYYQLKYKNGSGTDVSMIISKQVFEENVNTPGIFLPSDIFKSHSITGVEYIDSSANIELIGWDMAGNRTDVTRPLVQVNGLLKDTSINVLNSNPISIALGYGSGTTLNVSNQVSPNSFGITVNLAQMADNVGIAKFRVINFRDERGNSVSSNYKVGGTQYEFVAGELNDMAKPINAQSITRSTEFITPITGSAIQTLVFAVNPNAPFIGGKVRVNIEVFDHLGNSHTFTRDFLVQRSLNIRSQDKNTNRETTIQIQQGQQGDIINRREGGRQ